VIGWGAAVLIASMTVVFSPLLLGQNAMNKYLVAFGLVGACAGLSIMLHGAVDWLRRPREAKK
jgi:hypothetical protein